MGDEPNSTPRPRSDRLVAWLDPKLILPFAQSLVILLVGWWIKDGVSLALQKRQLDLANVREMRELLLELSKPSQDLVAYRATASALAPFGSYAIVPLILVIQDGEANQSLAAETGLRIIAIRDPEIVTAELIKILNNRSRLYGWRAHLSAVRLLGELGAGRARHACESYWRALGGEAATDSTRALQCTSLVREDAAPTADQVMEVVLAVKGSLANLRSASGGRRS
jgi:hypothetical protein